MSDERLKTGTEVAFRLGDVTCPDFERMVDQLGPELAVRGEVVLLSDGGSKKGQFAVIDVPGIHTPVIVPVGKLISAAARREAEASERMTEGLTERKA